MAINREFDEDEFNILYSRKVAQSLEASLFGRTLLEETLDGVDLPLPALSSTSHISSRNRLRDKVLRCMNSCPSLTLQEILDTQVKDYAGGRLIVHFISYIPILYEYFYSLVMERSGVRLYGDANDYMHVPKVGGWRGLQQIIEFEIEPDIWFPYEVQFLTFLQYDWIRKQGLFYEDTGNVPVNIEDLYAGFSDRLHQIEIEEEQALLGREGRAERKTLSGFVRYLLGQNV